LQTVGVTYQRGIIASTNTPAANSNSNSNSNSKQQQHHHIFKKERKTRMLLKAVPEEEGWLCGPCLDPSSCVIRPKQAGTATA
jgi:hypothetical protein